MDELRDIKGLEGLYAVTRDGRVWSYPKPHAISPHGGKFLSPSTGGSKPYPKVLLMKNNKRYYRNVHRLVAEAFVENPNNLPQVNHKDGNPENNRAENLEWCTGSHNILHAIRSGLQRIVRGEERAVKLTDAKIRAIRNSLLSGGQQREVAKEFGVSQSHVSNIKNKKVWNHV